jgi:signal transduction histidine kinase
MKHFEGQKDDKPDEIKDKILSKNLTNTNTQNFIKNISDLYNDNEFKKFSLAFLDPDLENIFLNSKKIKSIWTARFFKIITLIYVLLNIIMLPPKTPDNYSYTFSTAASYTLAVLNILTIILNFYFTKSCLYFTLLYLEYLIFSLSHFIFLNEIREMNNDVNSLLYNVLNSTAPFIFSFTDIILKLIFIFTLMNNFIFLFYTTIANFLLILIFFITCELLYFTHSPLALIFYFLGNVILIFLSRKLTYNEKILFKEEISKINALKNAEEEVKIFNFIKCGYFKIFNNQIKEKNNFFEQEYESLKNYIKNKEKYSDKNLIENLNLGNKDLKLKREKTKNYNPDTSSKTLLENTHNTLTNAQTASMNFLTNEDCEDIIKNLLLNISDTEKFKIELNLFLGNILKPNKTNSVDERKSVESVLKFKGPRPFASNANTLEFESSVNIFLENNNKERDKESFYVTHLNPNNITSNFNNKISNNFNTHGHGPEEHFYITENLNNTKPHSAKLEQRDTKLTINNILNSSSLNKGQYLNNVNTVMLQHSNTSLLDQTQTAILNSSIFEYFAFNKNKFETFIKLGKSTVTNGSDKILSLEVLARVNEDNSIEFIFNDVSKYDYASGFKQFLIKTGQYLHDFKNPLICIQNEIMELKEENEILMALVIKHNEFIDNYNKQMINISGATGSAVAPTAQKIEFSLQECLLVLDKFEYTRQMSEYCQNMIGSYEDFSKSIFSPQNVKISIQNFDLLKLVNFIDSMMQFQLSRSNKNINFVLKLVNFESNPGQERSNTHNLMSSNHKTSNDNYFYEKKTSLLERRLTSELIPNLKKINTIASSHGLQENDNNKCQVSEKDFEIFEKPEIIGSDEAKLKRVLINILSNSQKFTISGTITLTINKEISNGIKYYKFSISDTGVGMSPEDLEKLFTPFFSNNNNEMNKNGVGLGLVNVKEITEVLGQGLKVTSELGKGTTMSFVIEDRYIDPNANINIFSEKKTLNNINEVSESIDSDPILDNENDITQEVNAQHFNLIFKKLPNMEFLDEKDSDRIYYQIKKKESQILSSFDFKKDFKDFRDFKDFKDFRQEKYENSKFGMDKTCESPISSLKQTDFPYVRSGYTIVRHSPKVISRQLKKNSPNLSQFSNMNNANNLNRNLEGLTVPYINITGTDSIKCSNSSHSNKQGLSSFLRTRKTWAVNSIISSTTKFFDKVNTMSNLTSNIKFFSTFSKLTIQNDINFEVKGTYDKLEKDRRDSISNLSLQNFNLYKKSNNQNSSQLRSKGNNNDELSSNPGSLSKFFEARKKMSQFGEKNLQDKENLCGSKNDEEENNIEQDQNNINTNFSKTLNVLLIDDEQSIRAFTKNSFKKISESEKIKFNIDEADDGISGLEKILYKYLRDQETYDIIIADDTMTFLDGSQLFKLLGLLIENEFFKRKLPLNIVNKFLICSSDSENVKNKIEIEREIIQNNLIDNNDNNNNNNFFKINSNLMNCLEICDKPLNMKFLKQFC